MDFSKVIYRDQDAAFFRLVPLVSMHRMEPCGSPTVLFVSCSAYRAAPASVNMSSQCCWPKSSGNVPS